MSQHKFLHNRVVVLSNIQHIFVYINNQYRQYLLILMMYMVQRFIKFMDEKHF